MYRRGLQNVVICFIEWAHAICTNLGYGGSFSSSDSRNDEGSQVWCCMRGKQSDPFKLALLNWIPLDKY